MTSQHDCPPESLPRAAHHRTLNPSAAPITVKLDSMARSAFRTPRPRWIHTSRAYCHVNWRSEGHGHILHVASRTLQQKFQQKICSPYMRAHAQPRLDFVPGGGGKTKGRDFGGWDFRLSARSLQVYWRGARAVIHGWRVIQFGVDSRAKRQARVTANVYQSRGRVTRRPCEICGAPAEKHHDDYARPLEVRWLCRPHHVEWHKMNRRAALKRSVIHVRVTDTEMAVLTLAAKQAGCSTSELIRRKCFGAAAVGSPEHGARMTLAALESDPPPNVERLDGEPVYKSHLKTCECGLLFTDV
jgi:hypothetical protein